MNPPVTEVKAEQKNEQAQIPNAIPSSQSNVNATPIHKESEPEIKSEENQANWKAFREKREAERKAGAEAQRIAKEKSAEAQALREALEASMAKSPPRKQEEFHEEQEETEEQRIDRKVEAAIKQREEKDRLERLKREQEELPFKLKQAHSDFEQICSQENIDYIEYHFPEVARAFSTMPNNFENLSMIYKAMKKLVPNIDSRRDERRAEKNLMKPGSVSSPAGNATSQDAGLGSARLTEERRAQNWARMQKTLKGLTQ